MAKKVHKQTLKRDNGLIILNIWNLSILLSWSSHCTYLQFIWYTGIHIKWSCVTCITTYNESAFVNSVRKCATFIKGRIRVWSSFLKKGTLNSIWWLREARKQIGNTIQISAISRQSIFRYLSWTYRQIYLSNHLVVCMYYIYGFKASKSDMFHLDTSIFICRPLQITAMCSRLVYVSPLII